MAKLCCPNLLLILYNTGYSAKVPYNAIWVKIANDF